MAVVEFVLLKSSSDGRIFSSAIIIRTHRRKDKFLKVDAVGRWIIVRVRLFFYQTILLKKKIAGWWVFYKIGDDFDGGTNEKQLKTQKHVEYHTCFVLI